MARRKSMHDKDRLSNRHWVGGVLKQVLGLGETDNKSQTGELATAYKQ